MGIPIYDDLVYYATPPNSYVGSAIFLFYIVAALYATLSIVIDLYKRYASIYHSRKASKDAKLEAYKAARVKHIKIYAFLVSISFATLSYHMLFFLITHYLNWTGDKHRDLSAISGSKIKGWMLQSTLFQDFASELVQSKGNAAVTQVAILGTWYWNIWMAAKARTRRFDASTMRNFILLSQILPISFTISLFLIELHVSSPDIQPPASKNKATSKSTTLVTRAPIASLQLPNILLNACLLAQPSLRKHSIFNTLIILERFVLLLPHTGLISLKDSDVDKSMMISAGFMMASQWMGRKDAKLGAELQSLLKGGFAVKALGWDAVLGAVVGLCLSWGGGV
ncbi:hypothetical protein HBI44_047770 [Parastagonospora nodorum]|nr:hypothetical protein HBI44_047770 [Parastagonospora nodorum]